MSRSTRPHALAAAAVAALATLGVFVSTSAGSPTSAPSTQRPASALLKQSVMFRARPAARATSTPYIYEASNVASLSAAHYTEGNIKCPSSHPTPVSGMFNDNSTAVYVSASYSHKGGWYTRIDNDSTTTAAKVQIGAVCGA